jgi:hypothetical protein
MFKIPKLNFLLFFTQNYDNNVSYIFNIIYLKEHDDRAMNGNKPI